MGSMSPDSPTATIDVREGETGVKRFRRIEGSLSTAGPESDLNPQAVGLNAVLESKVGPAECLLRMDAFFWLYSLEMLLGLFSG